VLKAHQGGKKQQGGKRDKVFEAFDVQGRNQHYVAMPMLSVKNRNL